MTSAATEEHREKFPREWAAFSKANKQMPIPLSALPNMTPSIVAAFTELGIRSVADVATKEVPGYLQRWKPWAIKILSIHEFADKPKPKLRVVDGQMVPA